MVLFLQEECVISGVRSASCGCSACSSRLDRRGMIWSLNTGFLAAGGHPPERCSNLNLRLDVVDTREDSRFKVLNRVSLTKSDHTTIRVMSTREFGQDDMRRHHHPTDPMSRSLRPTESFQCSPRDQVAEPNE